MEIPSEYKKNVFLLIIVFLTVVSLLFAARFLSELKSYTMIGSSEVSTITVSGHGEISAVPDIASVYFTISKDAKTVKEAQASVAQVENKALEFLEESNILERDIKTSNSSFYPKYEYQYETRLVPCTQYDCPPRPGKSVIVGYTASESITVKIRNVDEVGKIIEGLGNLGISNLNGPNFSIDNEEGLKVEARKSAISDAKDKAEILAKDLGVRLGKVVSFNESGDYPRPMYSNAMMKESASLDSVSAVIPKGENTISSDVSIVYEIK